MAKKDTGKWVARAGATGGGRTYRGQAPINWYLSLVLITILGVASVVYSRYERQHPSSSAASSSAPAIGTHWLAAFDFDVCGKVQPNPPTNPNLATAGIHTRGDGLIHISPTKASDAGANATLGRFVQLYPRMQLSSTSLRYPGGRLYRNGDTCPKGTPDAGKRGKVDVKVWSTPTSSQATFVSGDPAALRLKNGQLITMAFLPKGASVPKPSAQSITALLQGMSKNVAGSSSSGTPSTPAPTSTPSTPSGHTGG
jgi:hypothetical protein